MEGYNYLDAKKQSGKKHFIKGECCKNGGWQSFREQWSNHSEDSRGLSGTDLGFDFYGAGLLSQQEMNYFWSSAEKSR